MSSRTLGRRTLVVLFGALAIGGSACAGEPIASPSPLASGAATDSPAASALGGSTAPTPWVTASPAPSESPAPTLSPDASTPPQASPTPSTTASTPPAGLALSWRREAAAFGDDVQILKSAVVGERIVVIGRRWRDDDTGSGLVPAIWWEDEDLVWRAAEIPSHFATLHEITAGGSGLVVVGFYDDEVRLPLVWTSSDGASWSSARIDVGQRSMSLYRVATAVDGLVAFGSEEFGEWAAPEPVALVSHDGRAWLPATNQSTHELFSDGTLDSVIVGSGADLTALVHGGRQPVAVWRAAGRDDWHKVGELPGSRRSIVDAAAVGQSGWVALGSSARAPRAWTSSNGVHWQLAENAPAPVQAVFADRTGFVAVSVYDPVGGCVVDPRNWRNLTWTSVDGRIWRLVDEMGDGARIESLRRRGRTLIGIGMIGEQEGAVWTARLPGTQLAEGPLPTPVALGSGGGCGP